MAGPGLEDRRTSLKKQVSKGPLAVPSRLPVAEHLDSQHLEASGRSNAQLLHDFLQDSNSFAWGQIFSAETQATALRATLKGK